MIDPTILGSIKTFGFPIVAFLLMFWQNTKIIGANTEALNKLSIIVASCPKK